MSSPLLISDYYRTWLEQAKQEIDATSDDRVLGMDEEEWLKYLVEKYSRELIEIDEGRGVQMAEDEVEYVSRGYDVYTNRGAGSVVRRTQVKVSVPVVPSETLREIWKHGLAPNMFSFVRYPEFDYDDRRGLIETLVEPNKASVTAAVAKIRESINRYNSSINDENQKVKQVLASAVHGKRQRVTDKHSQLDTLAAQVGIPLIKKSDPSRIVPTAPRVREKIAPVMPPATKRQERPVLDAEKFRGILDLIDNQCRGFERTPQAYNALSEEGLRDIVLGSLNAVFEGAAGGETFQGIGKVDIHLRIAQGEVFVAEVKFWAGEASLHETVGQLRGRLTWRDSYGVAILLSKNLGFTDVLKTVNDAIPKVEGYAATVRRLADNHFVARFSIPSDPGRQAELHVLVYNLYVEQPGKRQTRRTT
jgi:hypothetical protein